MKIFKYLAIVGLAAASSVSKRSKRATTVALSGEENLDDLQNILDGMTAGNDDELEKAIMAFIGTDRISGDAQLRKFRQLKIAVLALQKEQKFGRYCYYGCYCLPEGSHNIASGGYGSPMDPIDRACFDFKQCYKCLQDEHDNQCAGEDKGYSLNVVTDADGKNSLECGNTPDSCRYNICQCDKRLAEQLAIHEDSWNETLHAVQGGFLRENNCYKGSGGQHKFEECCGDKTTFPFNQPRRDNQCCDGPYAKPDGQC